MSYASDAVMEEWRAIVRRVEEVADVCERTPHEAFALGVVAERLDPELQTFGGERYAAPQNVKAMWLRAAAKALIPTDRWQWSVVETMGGFASLALQSYREPDALQNKPEAP